MYRELIDKTNKTQATANKDSTAMVETPYFVTKKF